MYFIHIRDTHSLHPSPNVVRVIKSRRLRWAGHVARIKECRSAFKFLTGKPIGKKSLGRPRRNRNDNFTMDLKEIGINSMNWIDSVQDRSYWRSLLNKALNLRFYKLWI